MKTHFSSDHKHVISSKLIFFYSYTREIKFNGKKKKSYEDLKIELFLASRLSTKNVEIEKNFEVEQ